MHEEKQLTLAKVVVWMAT